MIKHLWLIFTIVHFRMSDSDDSEPEYLSKTLDELIEDAKNKVSTPGSESSSAGQWLN